RRTRRKASDSNDGAAVPGAVRWMTAGRGLVHSEMPEQESGRMRGFQLWVNLPARDKMTDPRYQEFAPDRIPEVRPAEGVVVKVIAGTVGDAAGPISQPATDPIYLDVSLSPGSDWQYDLPEGHAAFAYVFEGESRVGHGEDARSVPSQTLAVLGGGDTVAFQAGDPGARL